MGEWGRKPIYILGSRPQGGTASQAFSIKAFYNRYIVHYAPVRLPRLEYEPITGNRRSNKLILNHNAM